MSDFGKFARVINEFLDNSLNDHRKVFEVLASKMQCLYEEQQLAGLGFSSTQRNDLTVKVQGPLQERLRLSSRGSLWK